MGSSSQYDEEDIRIRPSRSTKPRSKDRPQHLDATQARVITIDRGRITCATPDGVHLLAVAARELGRRSVVVGDLVHVVGIQNPDQAREDLARIVRIQERRNVLRRSAEDGSERILVANIDFLAIVSANTNPEPKHGFVNRALVAAYTERIRPILVMTKSDLARDDEFLSVYKAIEVPTFQVRKDLVPRDLLELISGKVTVLIGHSGVGKSTLINNLTLSSARQTGEVTEVTGKGRHTSSSAYSIELPEGGWIIDTPGVRSFGLSHVTSEDVLDAFPDCAEIAGNCPKNCSHDEQECALNLWAEGDSGRMNRIFALRQILESIQ